MALSYETMDARDLTLKVSPRSARILYVAESREDVLRAVRLYTHTWGGSVNAILPLPQNEVETALFRHAVTRHDPDLIFATTGEVAGQAAAALSPLPYPVAGLSDQSLTEHIEGPNALHTRSGSIPHVIYPLLDLHPHRLPESNVRVIESPDSHFSFELALHFGLPGTAYQSFLLEHLRAKQLRCPEAIEQFVKAILIAAVRPGPASLTTEKLSVRYTENLFASEERTPLGGIRVSSEQSLLLFLDDGQDTHTPAAFWNARRVSQRSNKFLLPRDAFLSDLPACLSLLLTGRSLAEVVAFTPTSCDEAAKIQAQMQAALAADGVQLPVAVYYSGYGYEMRRGSANSGPTETISRVIGSDGSVRFRPTAPGWLPQQFVFGYDAEVDFATGERLSLPPSRLTSVLLLNEMERLRRAEANEQGFGELWLRHDPIMRARKDGIAGLANPGTELRFYVHDEELIVSRVLQQRGLRVAPNRHTRYARGFIRRFGGFGDTLALVRAGGGQVLAAFDRHRAEQCGLKEQQIISDVQRHSRRDPAEVRAMVDKHLPRLLAKGLVRRGTALECPHCYLKDWYPVDSLREFVECAGCAEPFQLSRRGLGYHFVANELARRLIHEGGHAVLQTASVLRQIEFAGAMQFGGDVFRGQERTNFVEIDLFLLSAEAFAIAECKAWNIVREDDLAAVEQSLARTVRAAPEFGADIVFLGVVTNEPPGQLFALVQAAATEAAGAGIGVHLILNDRLHIAGEEEATEVDGLGLGHLITQELSQPKEISVGSLAQSLGFGSLRRTPDVETVAAWEPELFA